MDADLIQLAELIGKLVDSRIAATAPASQPDDFLTVRDAAELASVHVQTIRRWVREQKLERYAAGSDLRVRRRDLIQLLRDGGRVINLDELSPEEMARRDLR